MNAIKLKLSLIFLSLCTIISLKSQTFIGLQQSNYSGIHQVNLNPANIANSRHRIYINAFTMGFGFNNDYLSLNMPFSLQNLATNKVPAQYHKNGDPNAPVDFQDAWLKENVNGKGKNLNLYTQFRSPGIMISLPMGFAVGLQYKNTVSFQINDMAEPLARLSRYGVDSSKGNVLYSGPNQYKVGERFEDNAFTVNFNAYGELGGTIAKTIIKNEYLVLKAGFTGKYLMGYASGYIKNKGIQFRLPNNDTIIFNKTDVEYGYTDPAIFENLKAVNLDYVTQKLKGAGFGYDFGATVEYSPEGFKKVTNKKNNYLLSAGASILDAGGIFYKNNLRTTHITNENDKYFDVTGAFGNAWTSSKDGLKFTDSIMRTLFKVDSAYKNIKTTMPTTINLQFDYNLFKNLFVGANLSQDLRGKKTIGIRKPSYLVVIPRFESKLFEISLPMGLMNDYKTGRIGVFVRLGPVFVGSDNIIGQLKSNNFYGADFYFGISSGITSKSKAKKSASKN
ncbi:MAG: DUF5723 family protein [bacterium]|nr:DUF5723 family protein [bacterium]